MGLGKNIVKWINPPKFSNELIKYNVNPDNVKLLCSFPIDNRLLVIENAFEDFAYLTGQYSQNYSDISPLFYSSYFIKTCIRDYIAECSDYKELYHSPTRAFMNIRDSYTYYKIPSYDIHNVDGDIEVIENLLEALNYRNMINLKRLIKRSIENIFSIDTPLYNKCKDQVVLFNIKDYVVDIYTLGHICEYRYNEKMYGIPLSNTIHKVINSKSYHILE